MFVITANHRWWQRKSTVYRCVLINTSYLIFKLQRWFYYQTMRLLFLFQMRILHIQFTWTWVQTAFAEFPQLWSHFSPQLLFLPVISNNSISVSFAPTRLGKVSKYSRELPLSQTPQNSVLIFQTLDMASRYTSHISLSSIVIFEYRYSCITIFKYQKVVSLFLNIKKLYRYFQISEQLCPYFQISKSCVAIFKYQKVISLFSNTDTYWSFCHHHTLWFFTIPHMKMKLKCCHFETNEEIQNESQTVFKAVAHSQKFLSRGQRADSSTLQHRGTTARMITISGLTLH